MPDSARATFAELVHLILVHERGHSLKEVAELLGMKYHTFYARLRGRAAFTPEDVQTLIRVIGDPRVPNFLLTDTGFIAVEQAEAEGEHVYDLHRGATRSVIEVTDVLRTVERALANNRIDHIDRVNIRKEIDEAERALAALRNRLETL